MLNLRVLIIDDELEWANTLAERLELRGIDVDFVTTYKDALDKLDDKDYNVVLLDMVLQRTRGIDVLKEIKKKNPKLSVVLVSGRGSDEEVNECKQEGAFDYLIKPIQIEELIKVMKQAVQE